MVAAGYARADSVEGEAVIATHRLANGETVAIAADYIPFDAADFVRRHETAFAKIKPRFVTARQDILTAENLRAMLFDPPRDGPGACTIVDAAGAIEPADPRVA